MILKLLNRYGIGHIPMIHFPSQQRYGHVELQYSGKKIKMTNREALNQAIREQMVRDPDVFLIGEEVALYNGAYKISKGLYDQFGIRRVVDTPISETGFTGLGVGAALMGLKPIVEFMTMNFSLQSIDQIINSSAKIHYMSSGILSTPIVFRGLNGPAAAVAAQHSQCFASMYANVPGLITISPYDAEDCKGLLKAAIRDPNPVVFLENENLYGVSFEVPEEVERDDFILPIGKAKIMVEGTDITIVGYSRNVMYSLEAATILGKQGISCEVINLRSIRPLDRDTIIKSVIKTGRLIVVEDGFPTSGVGSQIIAIVHETKAFDYLKCSIERVSGIDAPMPYAKNLEDLAVPKADTICKAAYNIMRKTKK